MKRIIVLALLGFVVIAGSLVGADAATHGGLTARALNRIHGARSRQWDAATRTLALCGAAVDAGTVAHGARSECDHADGAAREITGAVRRSPCLKVQTLDEAKLAGKDAANLDASQFPLKWVSLRSKAKSYVGILEQAGKAGPARRLARALAHAPRC